MDPRNKEIQQFAEEEEDNEISTSLDWRGRPSDPNKHGGMKASAFVLGLQVFEIMAIAAVGNNLITYLINEMHFPLTKSANTVTNFVGTIFLITLLGGFVSDSYLGSFWTLIIFGFVELSGFLLLSVQAHLPQLKPPHCDMSSSLCLEAKGFQSFIFFMALYLVAFGSGCVKPNMIAHGADQFNKTQSDKLSTYFNAAYFAFSIGELLALTVLVWVQTHSGMDVGFGVSAAAMAMGLITLVSGTLSYRNKRPRRGTIFTPVAQVLVAAISNRNEVLPENPKMLHGNQLDHRTVHTERFRFLDKACIVKEDDGKTKHEMNPWRLCTVTQVEQVKIVISLIPIFASTIVFNTILAQLQTFSVQQGRSMDTHLITSSFTIPPASLQAIPYLLLIFLVPLYDSLFIPLARRFTGHASGISSLQRIGFGLFLCTFSMVSAALMEEKRRSAAVNEGKMVSIFWITPQFLIFGVSEMFTAVGLVELFYKQSPKGMQAFLTAMTYCSYSFGFYLSSALVSVVNKISSGSNGGWLKDNDLNKDRLDLFYWVLAGLAFLNFLSYLFWCSTNSSHATARPVETEKMDCEGGLE